MLHSVFLRIVFPFFILFFSLLTHYTKASYSQAEIYFNQAYSEFNNLPKGILEAVSWHQTRIEDISASEIPSCSGMPLGQGYMGLVVDGKSYFNSTAAAVSKKLNLQNNQQACTPVNSIKGYAALLSEKLTVTGKTINQTDWKKVRKALEELSEIPNDGNPVNDFARASFVFEVFRFLNDASKASLFHFTAHAIDLKQVFGDNNYKILSAQHVTFTKKGITTGNGIYFKSEEPSVRSAQYGPAIWTPAPSCNYSSRNGTPVSAITIHTVQGSYAGAISWAQNCNSSVSYHYVIRSSDGQVTQMVDESIKAWHVGSENPYTVGYEHEGYVSNPAWYTTAMYNSSADLSRDICNSGYGINPLRTYYGASSSGTNVLGGCTKIKGHQHYPNQTHTDPGINWNWELYYKLINNNPSVTTITSATGNFYDSGGAGGNYTDDERLLWLFAPTGASTVTLTFSQFNIEANWDYLFIYDGNSTSSPLIGVYTGTNSPGAVSSTGGSLLVEFRSDCNTVSPGWAASYASTTPQPADITPPTTQLSTVPYWATQNFTTTFTDVDNTGGSGIEKAYYQVIDLNAGDWRANAQKGFFSDNFDQISVHTDWTSVTGNWTLNNGALRQTDDSQNNTNIYAYVNHSLSNRYLYHWSGRMTGAGTNRRSGLHYFCDSPTLTNRGNSYFVWFRLDTDEIQLYEVVNDVFTMVASAPYNFTDGQWYDYKLIYDRITGKTMVYVDNVLKITWIDTTPYSSGNYVSFRSGNSVFDVDNFKIYRSRNATALVEVGPSGDLRYQNANPGSPAGRIKSITNDNAGNISSVSWVDVNVDTTAPSVIAMVNDGPAADIDIFYTNTSIEANWSISADTHSDIATYWYCIGTTPGGTNVANWTNNAWYDSLTLTGLSLTYGQTYYVTVKAENGAGLQSASFTSDGMLLDFPTAPPQAAFAPSSTIICDGDSITFSNSSINATTYQWLFPGGAPSSSTLASPTVYYSTGGMYTVTLVANGPGGTDTITSAYNVVVNLPPVAAFTVTADTVTLPNAMVGFTNQSQNADGYAWYFGDGNFSNGASPWNIYTTSGVYTVTMIASAGGCANDTVQTSIVVLGGQGMDEMQVINLEVYPNPASEMLIVQGDIANSFMELIDETGRMVLTHTSVRASKREEINLQKVATGMYTLRITHPDYIINKPVLIWR